MEFKGQSTDNFDMIDARDNRIANLPNMLTSCMKLQDLLLDGNQITDLKNPLKVLIKIKHIKKLGLKNQRNGPCVLQALPSSFFRLEALQEVYLGQNGFSEFPAVLCEMMNLKIIDMENNKIEQVPNEIGQLTELEYLGLRKNNIKALPETIGSLRRLKVLRLSENKIGFLPDRICELENLQTLSLKRNPLVALPEHFYKLTKLTQPGTYKVDAYDMEYGNLCSLPKSSLRFPPKDIVEEGLEDIMEHLKALQRNPKMLESQLKEAGIRIKPKPGIIHEQ